MCVRAVGRWLRPRCSHSGVHSQQWKAPGAGTAGAEEMAQPLSDAAYISSIWSGGGRGRLSRANELKRDDPQLLSDAACIPSLRLQPRGHSTCDQNGWSSTAQPRAALWRGTVLAAEDTRGRGGALATEAVEQTSVEHTSVCGKRRPWNHEAQYAVHSPLWQWRHVAEAVS